MQIRISNIAARVCRRQDRPHLPSTFLFPSPSAISSHSVLVVIASAPTYKYHRPAPLNRIRSLRQLRPPFFLYLVCDFSFLFSVRSVPIRRGRCRLMTLFASRTFPFLSDISPFPDRFRDNAYPTGGRTTNNRQSTTPYSLHRAPRFRCGAGSIVVPPS